MKTPNKATEGMEKIVMHGPIQKGVTNALVEKIAMRGPNQKTMTKTVGNQECRCATEFVN